MVFAEEVSMKYLFAAALTAVLLVSCQSSRDSGRPGEESFSQTGSSTNEPNNRIHQSKPNINLRQGWNN
jgi:hypothetical protein